jgi:hypothetical protein
MLCQSGRLNNDLEADPQKNSNHKTIIEGPLKRLIPDGVGDMDGYPIKYSYRRCVKFGEDARIKVSIAMSLADASAAHVICVTNEWRLQEGVGAANSQPPAHLTNSTHPTDFPLADRHPQRLVGRCFSPQHVLQGHDQARPDRFPCRPQPCQQGEGNERGDPQRR